MILYTLPTLYLQLIQPVITGKPIDESRVELSAKVMKSSLKKMEMIYLKDTPFLNSDTMSIADLLGICEVMQPQLGLKMNVLADFPKVTKWSHLVRETIGTELFDEAHKFIAIAGNRFEASKVPTPKL